MACPVSFSMEIEESVSEDLLARLVRLCQGIIREYMTPEQIDEEIGQYDLLFRDQYPVSVFDHSPDSGELMFQLEYCQPFLSDGTRFWKFACPVRFCEPIEFAFAVEVTVIGSSGRVTVDHGIWGFVLEGDCFLPEEMDGAMDKSEVMEKCQERVRSLLTRLFAEFESQFQVVEKGKTSSSGFEVPWSVNGVEWDLSG